MSNRIPDEVRHKALKGIARDFLHFSRNGRWGHCALCPHDAQGNLYPEMCLNTKNTDHHKNATTLAQMYQMKLDSALTVFYAPSIIGTETPEAIQQQSQQQQGNSTVVPLDRGRQLHAA